MAQRYTAREMLEKLVAFPTVSSESNLELIEFVKNYLADHGVESHLVYDPTGQKASLYAHIGPMIEGAVVLSGHTDVVPVEGQPWDTDPFTVTEKDGKLYGRGTCDMKGFDALVLAAVPDMVAADLKRPIQIALSYDEEVGCIGAPFMIDEMKEKLPPAAAAIIGEPSMMETVSAHKGTVGLITKVRGFEVHSSLIHTGVSAVMTAARLITWLDDKMAENRAKAEAEGGDHGGFVPPWTTFHAGTIKGGTALNITSRDCEFLIDYRVMPNESIDGWIAEYKAECARLEAEIQKIRPECYIDTQVTDIVPPLAAEPAGEAETIVRALTGDNATHVVAYATEAGQFQERGYSAVICGPGSITQAHQANEYLSLDQLAKGENFIQALIERCS